MDTKVLVASRMEDVRQLLEQLVRDGFPVTAAFWARTDADGPWRLFIASPSVSAEKVGEAYGPLYASLSKLQDPWIELSEIRLLPAKDPAAIAALKVRDRDPDRMPTKYPGNRLGNLSFEEAYIYPPVEAKPGPRPIHKWRIIGRREGPDGGKPAVVEDEIGIVEGVPGEEAFNKGWRRLVSQRFGDVESFATHYPKGILLVEITE